MSRITSGALAGLAGTMVMTMAMRRLHAELDNSHQYPLPPREIIDRVGMAGDEQSVRAQVLAAHFGFGAAAGAIYALLPSMRGRGALYGIGVWTLSYLGWVPGAGILGPAWRHPTERNLLMIAVHVVWGVALDAALRELQAAEKEVFGRPAKAQLRNRELRETAVPTK
jgi:uncharacterized membrane protein YagU involved in acid resistance